jgi:cell wall-associated NlpC family hydrolase
VPSGQLVYNPRIQVLIDTNSDGIIDVSSDIISFQLNRISNGVSTFSCTLNNKNRKYTINSVSSSPIIETLNRIVVNMTRTSTLQVFSGYVTKAPIFTVLPNAIQIEAKCTIKRLQDIYWDSSIPQLRAILPGMWSKIQNEGNYTDGGAAQGVANLLYDVANWQQNQIYISKLPDGFLHIAATEFANVNSTLDSTLVNKLIAAVDGNGVNTSGGAGATAATGTNYAWAMTVLSEAGLPTSTNNVNNVVCWMAAEHPPDDWWGKNGPKWKNNPLNTTVGVDSLLSFPDLPTSASNTAKTIQQENMKSIYNALKNDASLQIFSAAASASPWDAGHYNNDPNYIASIPQPKVVAVPGATSSFNQVAAAAIDAAKKEIGLPYSWGGGSTSGPTLGVNQGATTVGFDCSGLTRYAYAQAGVTIPRSSEEQWTGTGTQFKAPSIPLPGDLLFWEGNPPGHVTLCVTSPDSSGNNGTQIEAQQTGTTIKIDSFSINDANFLGFTRPWANATGTSTLNVGTSAQDSSNTSSGSGSSTVDAFNTMFILPQWNPVAQMTYGSPRGFIMDEPVLNSVSQLCAASFRHFQSLGTGEFISWFPDYFGIYGTPCAMQIHNIEITRLEMYHSDDPLTTHVAVAGDTTGIGQSITAADWLSTIGIVSVQTQNIMNILFGENFKFDPNAFMQKYGMRPYVTTQPLIRSAELEFSYALMTFMDMWAQQYITDVELTFMPELFPGMRIQFPEIKFPQGPLECYVLEVNHEGSMTSGFTTRATLTAPSANGSMIYEGITV